MWEMRRYCYRSFLDWVPIKLIVTLLPHMKVLLQRQTYIRCGEMELGIVRCVFRNTWIMMTCLDFNTNVSTGTKFDSMQLLLTSNKLGFRILSVMQITKIWEHIQLKARIVTHVFGKTRHTLIKKETSVSTLLTETGRSSI